MCVGKRENFLKGKKQPTMRYVVRGTPWPGAGDKWTPGQW